MQEGTYSTRFQIQWYIDDDADAMPTMRRPTLHLPENENVFAIDMVDGIEEWTLDTPPEVPRAGAKSAKHYHHEPRAVMHTWALDRIQRELPEVSQATASLLLKAEARTVSAALHAKRPAQLQEVMKAAMRRTDINAQQNRERGENDEKERLRGVRDMLINQMAAVNEAMATKTDLNELRQQIQVQHMMIAQHLQHITRKLQELEYSRFVHQQHLKCPSSPPLTPLHAQQPNVSAVRSASPSPSLTPTVVASQPASHEEDQPTQDSGEQEQQRDLGEGQQGVSSPSPSLLKQLEAKSLMAQTQRNKGTALTPFGAKRSDPRHNLA